MAAFAAAWSERSGDTFSSLMHTLPKYAYPARSAKTTSPGTRSSSAETTPSPRFGLHKASGGELVVLGSPPLVQTLLEEDLVDELRSYRASAPCGASGSSPTTAGCGRSNWSPTVTAATGVNVCTYRP